MKKYISILAAVCTILLSGCAADESALSGVSGSSAAGTAPESSPTSGSSDVTGTSGTVGGGDTSSAAVSPEESAPAHTAGSDGSSGTHAVSTGEHDAPVVTEPAPISSDSSASVPPAVTDVTTAGTTTAAATEASTAPAKVPEEPVVPEEYAPSYIGGSGDSGDRLSAAAAEGVFDDVMADAPAAMPSMKSEAAVAGDYDYCPPYPEPYPEYEPEPPQAGLLTGGEWRDNDHWSDWKELYSSREDWNGYKNEWRIAFDSRVFVRVTADGQPLEGAKVICGGASAVTDNKGRAYLFRGAADGSEPITVSYGGVTEELDSVSGDAELSCELSGVTSRDIKKLDFMIMCDTTGSMSDELEYLQEELKDIITRIQHDNSNVPTRLSVNFYRDEGDDYVVCEYPFTEDIAAAVDELGKQYAAGGGDFPEAVHTALDSAINNHDWQEDSVKLMFLVLDAPPHNDPQIIDSVNSLVARASEQGIRIIPIASSGIDKSTEYLLRTMAFATGGTYTFLTNDSGIGGDHIEATVGAYNVERLNDMMVRIVNGYLED